MLLPIALFFGYWGHLAYKAAQKRAKDPVAVTEDSSPAAITPKTADLASIKQGITQGTQPLTFYRDQLWAFLETNPGPLEKAEALKLLGEVQLDLLYSTQEGPGKRGHLVEQGQSLAAIAQKYGSTVPAIVRANNLLGTNVQPEQHLVIPELGTLELHFYLSGQTMVVYWQGRFLKSYPLVVAQGKEPAKLVGEGRVTDKQVLKGETKIAFGEPDYYPAAKRVLIDLPGYQENLWLQESPAPETLDPNRAGLYLNKPELEEIFPLLTTATRVIIRE